jgi:branched-chain amino acid aminotransferase
MKAWVNGEYKHWEDVTVPVLSHGFGRGSAVFEVVDVISTEKGPAFIGLKEHVDRFFNSAKLMYMALPLSREEIIAACIETARVNSLKSGMAKFFAYYPAVELDVIPYHQNVDVAVFCLDFGPPKPGYKSMSDPVAACISSFRKIHPESVPVHAKATGNYVGGYLAKMKAKEQGFDDVILLDTMGFVAEGATSNVFFVKDRKIKTPTLRSVLPGINRMALIDIMRDTEFAVQETDIRPHELFECDEAFYTSSVAGIRPIKSIDGVLLGNEGPGPVTQAVVEKISDVYSGKIEKFQYWLTRI